MSRLTWRQRLIAIAVGIAAAVVQTYAPSHKAAHAAHAPAAACATPAVSNC